MPQEHLVDDAADGRPGDDGAAQRDSGISRRHKSHVSHRYFDGWIRELVSGAEISAHIRGACDYLRWNSSAGRHVEGASGVGEFFAARWTERLRGCRREGWQGACLD